MLSKPRVSPGYLFPLQQYTGPGRDQNSRGACPELGQLVTAPMGLVRVKCTMLCFFPMPPQQGLLGRRRKLARLF